MWHLVMMNRFLRFEKLVTPYKIAKNSEYPQIKEQTAKLVKVCLENDLMLTECKQILRNYEKHQKACETLNELAHSAQFRKGKA